jgi:hypothetical protein
MGILSCNLCGNIVTETSDREVYSQKSGTVVLIITIGQSSFHSFETSHCSVVDGWQRLVCVVGLRWPLEQLPMVEKMMNLPGRFLK